MLYDGECGFCCERIEWLRQRHGDQLDFLPFQAAEDSLPGLPREQLRGSMHLVLPDGRVFRAAEAALRLLALDPRHARWLRWYERDATFAELCETGYAFIARHRGQLSWLLRRLRRA